MVEPETDLGDLNQRFRTTIWSVVLAAGDSSDPRSRECLEKLCRWYWRPVYTYIRYSWRLTVEDAKDLTQAFFTHFLDKGYWSLLTPDKGSFRAYLKRALYHFMISHKKHEAVRREVKPAFSLDLPPEELDRFPASPRDTPDTAYDREWLRCLMDAAIAQLKEELGRESKPRYFEVFHAYFLDERRGREAPSGPEMLSAGPEASPTYATIAGRLGLQVSDIRNYLSFCRKRLRSIVRERIRDYVQNEDQVDAEWKTISRA